MPVHFDRVRPGDLIRSEFFNQIYDQIEQMQAQIDGLGTTSVLKGPAISGTIPPLEVHEKSELQILGLNFATPANLNMVQLGSISLSGLLPGSNDKLLRVIVPVGLAKSDPQTLKVSTTEGSASTQIRVVPEVLQVGGQPQIINTTSGLPTITAGQTFVFTFHLDGTALTTPETFQLQPKFTNATPAGSEVAWLTGTKLLGTAQNEVTISPTAPLDVGVQVIVPSGVQSVQLSLVAKSVHNSPASDATSLVVPITVGQAAPNSDPRIKLFIGPIGGAAKMRPALIGGVQGLEVQYATTPAGQSVMVPIDAQFEVGGNYAFAVSIDNPGTIWTVAQPTPATLQTNPGDAKTVLFNLTLKTSGPQSEKRNLTFKAVRQETTGVGQISAFSTFPVQGFAP